MSIINAIAIRYPPLFRFKQLFENRVGAVKGDLQSVHDKFALSNRQATVALDLGCGHFPKNMFRANKNIGIDLIENTEREIYKVRLGFEKLPFSDDYFDYITAYDLLEHIPRYSESPSCGNAPFIFLMNEVHRVMNKGGVFLSMTPIYPYVGAFQDPTHVNIMTVDTLPLYFSNDKLEIAQSYGVETNFEVCYQKMLGQHLIAVLKK